MTKHPSIPKNLAAVVLTPFVALSAQARDWSDFSKLASGAPLNMGGKMSADSFIPMEAHKLAHARLMWVNWDYLAAEGYPVGDRSMTPQIEKVILDALAYSLPGAKDEASDFLPEKKTFYTDHYGGDGLGVNMGGGRTGGVGPFVSKGFGRTPLATGSNVDHGNGAVYLPESIHEALYGEVNQDLPYGGNRVIAIIDRGTDTVWPDGNRGVKVMVIRQEALRPAHYVKAHYGQGPLMANEDQRVANNIRHVVDGLPVPANMQNAPPAERIRAGLFAMSGRIAEQYAAAYALRIFHGATSMSNVEIDGRFIDYGTETIVPDFGKFRVLGDTDYFGEVRELRDLVVGPLVTELQRTLPAELATRLPSEQELKDNFETQFARHHRREMLTLVGITRATAERIEKTSAGRRFFNALEKVATMGDENIGQDPKSVTYLTTFRFDRVAVRLAEASMTGAANLELVLQKEISGSVNQNLRAELARSAATVFASLGHAEISGLLGRALKLNGDRLEAGYRQHLFKVGDAASADYLKNRDSPNFAATINGLIAKVQKPLPPVQFCRALFEI